MAKETGIGWTTLTCDDSGGTPRVIINDVSNIQFAMPRAVQDVTGMDKSAIERLLLLADFSGTLNAPAFNDTTSTGFHQVFKTVPLQTSANRTLALAVSGQTLNNEILATDYAMTRGADGSLTASVPFVLADGTVPAWS
jgi:hypothetical protein